MEKTISVKYLADIPRLEFVGGKSDWIDLRAAKDIILKKGEFALIPLGVAMQLPEGYEAHVVPRSSTFKNWGILQANSIGIIDETYCGDNDEWKFPALCVVDSCFIRKGDRIAQFRIMPKMSANDTVIQLNTVETLGNADRGGFGSTGVA